MKTKNLKSGFTLLEILLVVGIIAILAGIVIVAINPAKQLAQVRNTERRSDIKQIDSALAQYFIDNNHYPTSTGELLDICDTGSATYTGSGCDGMMDLSILVPTYLQSIPTDPKGGSYSVLVPTTNGKVITIAPDTELQTYAIAIGTTTAVVIETPDATAPDAPTIGTATAGDGEASVAFTPGADGGSTITSYTVTSNPDSITATGSDSPVVVTGLTNDTAYTFTVTATNDVGESDPSAASNEVTPTAPVVATCVATGGATSTSGGYMIHTFSTVGNTSLIVSSGNCNAEVLVVGGGGGGGFNGGGGGGGGGVLTDNSYSLSTGTYNVTVGTAGTAGTSGTGVGGSGGSSIFDTLTALGGGGGGGWNGSLIAAANGGSGGGGGAAAGAKGNGSQGNNGGTPSGDGGYNSVGGGGGGYGSVGANGVVSDKARGGNGGSGYVSTITGSSVTYASGGGAGTYYYPGGVLYDLTYGIGGTGAGTGGVNNYTSKIRTATAATGYGCGGGGNGWINDPPGAGYKGVVIVKYAI